MKKFLILFIFLYTNLIFSQDIYKDLQLYLPMNCNALDSSGFSFETKTTGNPQCVEGRQYQALKFNGVDEYVSVPKDSSYRLISGKGFTWSVWIKSDDLPKNNQVGRAETIISSASPLDAEDIYLSFGSLTRPRNEIVFIVDGPGGAGASAAANKTELNWRPTSGFNDNEWYHFVGTRDYSNGKVALFVNGVKVDSATSPLSMTSFAKKLDFSIGRFSDGSSDIGSYFGGDIDEVRIYDRVITNQEILILYSARPEQIDVDTNLIEFNNIQCKSDSVIIVDLLNVGPSDFIISEMELKQGKEFSLLNSKEDIFLNDQQVYSLGVRFEPTAEGVFYDTLLIKNDFGVQPLILYLSGEKEVKIKVQDTLRFDELVECMTDKFISSTFYIYNENIDDSLEIQKIDLSDNFKASNTFSKIAKGDSAFIEIIFEPKSLGHHEEMATINFINCNQQREIYLVADYTKLDASYSDNHNFGAVENTILQSNTYTFKNSGTTNFEIQNVYFTGNNTQFSLITNSSDFPIKLIPNNSANLEIGFNPIGGATTDTMYIETSSLCGQKVYEIPIFGKGVYRANLTFEIPKIDAKIGEIVSIPIVLNEVNNLLFSEIDSIKVDFQINATTMIVSDLDYVAADKYWIDYSKILKINNSLSSQTMTLFNSEIVLGNSSRPEIVIKNISAVDGLLSYTAENGNVNIVDICKSGEVSRLFMSSFWLSVSEPAPNPSSGIVNFDFELIEQGQTDILLFDYSGNLVRVLFSNNVMPGKYTSTFDLSNFNDGVYFINIVTPSNNINKKLILRK